MCIIRQMENRHLHILECRVGYEYTLTTSSYSEHLHTQNTLARSCVPCSGVETASHAGHCPVNLVNVW